MDRLEILRKSELFCEIDNEQLSTVEKLCTPEAFESGAIICKQGDNADKIYVIEDGLVAIILEVGPLSQRQVQSASNFDIVGWSSMIRPYISTATVKAIERTKVLSFKAEELGRLFREEPKIGYKVGQSISFVVADRLQHAYTQLLGVTSQD
jgi:CRP-like cAMP-binding protein